MRVLIAGSPSKEFHLREFSNELNKKGFTSKVIIDSEYVDGFPSRKVSTWIKQKDLFEEIIKSFKPDFIFVDRTRHFTLKSVSSKIPVILHLRGDFWEEIEMAKKTIYKNFPKNMVIKKWELMGKECLDNSAIILPICNHLSKKTSSKYPNKKIQTLYQGINPKNWFFEEGMKLNHPAIGMVQSANIFEKANEMVILKKILSKFSNINFYWVGDGPYRKQILRELEQFPNFNWLGFLNYPKQIRQFYSEIDAYMLISGIDMSPLTLLEAQLMEKPVIATNVGGIPELMIDGVTGFLVKKGDSLDLEQKIRKILENNFQEDFGIQGRKFVMDNFDWNVIINNFKSIINSIH